MKWLLKSGQDCYKFNGKRRGLYPLIPIISLSLLLCTFLPDFIIPGNGALAFAQLYINEFMADNDSMIEDPDDPNNFDDWIEIYNSDDSTIDMGGMYLTDDPSDPTKWQIPDGVTIPAGGYLLFWANNDVEQGVTHTSFRLDADGEVIGLYGADGETQIDTITFGTQITDISYGRYPDGTDNWGFMSGTPGKANNNIPPAITGTTHIPVSPAEGDPVWVTCMVTDDSAVAGVTLTYNIGSSPVNITMHDDGAHNDAGSGDGLFGAQISPFAKNTIIDYYITATDNLGAESVDPTAAPVVTYYYIVDYEAPSLFINEFMADNDHTIKDPDDPNNFEDWIEIYNPIDSAVNMYRMYLTDDPNDPTKWQIPDGVIIPAGGYLLFWADNDEDQGDTHAGLRLNAAGEVIRLYGADGGTLIDSITFGTQITDISYGRYPDGTDNWGFMSGTPGKANTLHNIPPAITGTTHTPVSPAEGDPVLVTCMVTDDSDVSGVTLTYNTGSSPVNISMHDSADGLFSAQIPPFAKNTIIDYHIIATDNLGAESVDPTAAPAATYYYIVGYETPPLFINEFMADNDHTIEDPDDPNSFEDWIEIYNSGDSTVDMGGMYFTDDLENPCQWQVPDGVTIPAGGYLLLWADNDVEQGVTHTDFRLSKEGGEIGLFDTDAKRNMEIDTVIFGEQRMDISCGRIYDGEEPWALSENATPEYVNAFPLSTHPIFWTISITADSYDLMKEMGNSVNAIKRLDMDSKKWEAAYQFWGRPAGRNFPIESGRSYLISITSPCYFPL